MGRVGLIHDPDGSDISQKKLTGFKRIRLDRFKKIIK
jgi:hypothetical protein